MAPIEPGIYGITNRASHSSIRSYNLGEPIYVSSTREFPGPFELWEFTRTEGGFYITNVGLSAIASTLNEIKGAHITCSPTRERKASFEITEAGEDTYIIKAAGDLLWTVDPPIIPRGTISLQPANGEDTQRFFITPAHRSLE